MEVRGRCVIHRQMLLGEGGGGGGGVMTQRSRILETIQTTGSSS